MNYTVVPCDLDYNTYKQIIEDLIKKYPFLNVQLIGRTIVGRSIFALSLGNSKKSGICVGSVRGNDGLSGALLLTFTEHLCHAVKNRLTLSGVDIRKALSASGLTLIPCLNPDGREIFLHGPRSTKVLTGFVSSVCDSREDEWTGNAMGTDISRNFIFDESSLRHSLYRGDYPESEAETRALTRLCRTKSFSKCLELTSGEPEIFFKSNEKEPVSSRMMAKIISASSFLPVSAELSFEQPCIMDWFIKEFHRPAFTVGVGKALSESETLYKRLEDALTVFTLF